MTPSFFLRRARRPRRAARRRRRLRATRSTGAALPREEWVPIPIRAGDEAERIIIPNSAAPMAPGGGLELVVSARETDTAGIDGVRRELLAVSIFLVNSRSEALRRFGDLAFCFQARLQLDFDRGFENRDDRASYDATDFDERLADLHYRDVCSYAVGHNASGDWAAPDAEGRVTSVFTNPLPTQDVEKLGADIDVPGVERGMDALADGCRGCRNARCRPYRPSRLPMPAGRKPRPNWRPD